MFTFIMKCISQSLSLSLSGATYDVALSKTEDIVLGRLHRDAVFILQLIELNVGGR